MADRPFLPLYVADYLGDTQHLTNEEHGCYLRLLMHAWTAGGHLENDDKRLAILLGISRAKWRKLKPVILAFWHERDGKLYQKKLTEALEKAGKVSRVRKQAAERSWEKRRANASANAPAPAEQEHMQPRTHIGTDLGGPRSGVASSAKTRGTFIPTDWKPSDNDWNYAARKGLSPQEITDEAEKFVLYWKAAAGQRARKRDWAATWKTWVRNARSHAPRGAREPPSRTKLRELAQEDRARDGRSVLGDFLGQD